MVERRPAKVLPKSVNYPDAVRAIREFLSQRHTPSRELRRLDRRGDPDGAYPQSAADGLPQVPRHEMAGNFTRQAERRADRRHLPDLNPFPDWCWTGWETEMLRLPYIENRAVSLLEVECYTFNEACAALGRGARTLLDARNRGIRTLVVNLLAANPPPAR